VSSVEIPYSVAAALPTLSVFDITNEVSRTVSRVGCESGIAYVSPVSDQTVIRVNERESGFFCDVEELLSRIVPLDVRERERLLLFLLGPRSEQIPFTTRRLELGQWQRVLLFGFGDASGLDWRLTVVG
jgi:thiamine phosphate synthase YjbQ (UPF0047 family)